MQIQRVQNYQNNCGDLRKQPSFKLWERTIYEGASHRVKNCNYTYFGRDAEWMTKVIEFLEKTFKNVPKINFFSLGCSDGSEPFSLVMQMIALKKEEFLGKITPIIARDIDHVAIEKAETNTYEMYHMEKYGLDKAIKGKIRKFIEEPEGAPEFGQKVPIYLKPELYKHVDFAVGDANTEIEKINPNEPTVVFIRNTVPYMGTRNKWTNQKAFFEKLYNQLGENSYIALGYFDFERMGPSLHRMLRKAGFAKTEIPNLYRRKMESEKAVPMTLGEKIKEFFLIHM